MFHVILAFMTKFTPFPRFDVNNSCALSLYANWQKLCSSGSASVHEPKNILIRKSYDGGSGGRDIQQLNAHEREWTTSCHS